MEREFFTDNFENLLKENADQFKMSPSKKVWHGIYNDLHPGRRWPSAVMSITLIFTLVIIGHLNTQQSQHSYLTHLKKDVQRKKNTYRQNNSSGSEKTVSGISQAATVFQSKNSVARNTRKAGQQVAQVTQDKFASINNDEFADDQSIYKRGSITFERNNINLFGTNGIIENDQVYLKDANQFVLNEFTANTVAPNTVMQPNIEATFFTTYDNPVKSNVFANNITSDFTENKSLNARNETTHVPILKFRKKSKVSWTYYLSPVISYRTYSNSDENTSINSKVTHHSSAGLEAGTLMKYPLTKKLKFISGFQANYSAYTIKANNIHPITATLLLYDKQDVPYTVSSISFYGNGPGSAHLNLSNYSLQFSLPVGLEYKLAGNDNIQLNAAATFQPLFVVVNKAYIPSTDYKNYLTQAALSRRWNMSTNFGTYVSFNSNKLNWQIGPQVHYQLFSSYSNAYRLREHFIDYGVRFGISRIVR